jgi:hypothetical protein
MSKRHTVTLHHVITIYNDMFDHMDGVLRALAKKKTEWKRDIYFALRSARTKLTKYYSTVTPDTGVLLIIAHLLDPYRKLRTFIKWDKAMDVGPDEDDSYTSQYKETFIKYVESQYCESPGNTPQTALAVSESVASGSSVSPFDVSDDSDCEYYSQSAGGTQTTPGRSDRAARLMTAARLYLNSPPESPALFGQQRPAQSDYLADPQSLSATFWRPDVTARWKQQEETYSKYADLANVARDIFSIMPHGVGVESSFSLGRDVIGWRQTRTTGDSLREKVVVRQFARANNGVLAGDSADSTATEDIEVQKAAEEKKLLHMAQVHDFLDMWDGSQKLRRMQRAARAQNREMTAMGFISDTEETVNEGWSSFKHDGVAAFKASERTCGLPASLPQTELPDGRTQILNVRRIRRINRSALESDQESTSDMDTDSEDWLNWDGDVDDLTNDESEHSAAETSENDSLEQCSDFGESLPDGTENIRRPPALFVPGLVHPVRKSQRIEELAIRPGKTGKPPAKGGKKRVGKR